MMTFLELAARVVLAAPLTFADPGTVAEPQAPLSETSGEPLPLAPIPESPAAPPPSVVSPAPPVIPQPATQPHAEPRQESDSALPADDSATLALLLMVATSVGLAAWAIPRLGRRPTRASWTDAGVAIMNDETQEDGRTNTTGVPVPPNTPIVEPPLVDPLPPPTVDAARITSPMAALPASAPAMTTTAIAAPGPMAERSPPSSPVQQAAAPSAEIIHSDVSPQPAASPASPPVEQVVVPVPPPAAWVPTPGTVDAIRETRGSHSHQSWGSFNRDALPRLLFYGGNRFCQFSADRLEAADEWFVIGDIHGDFYALHTIVSFIREACPGFGIIFLGDLIDRGPHPIECLWYLLKVADDHPNRVLWLAGNHDVGVRFDETAGAFRSTVEPAEFVSDLNVIDSFAPLRRAFGREYIELSQGLPRAVVMPDGLLLTHGGFPHTDLQEEFAAITLPSDRRKWLESDPVIRDFTHLRITRYPLRRPNRLSISCSYGYRDFESFRRSMTGYNVKRLVTGHQHAATGYDDHPDWVKNGQEALTLTGFGFADAYDCRDAYMANYRRTLVAGRCRPDRLPEIVRIPVNERDLTRFFETEIATMPRFAAT